MATKPSAALFPQLGHPGGFFKFVGIINNPISVFLKVMGLKKGGENLE